MEKNLSSSGSPWEKFLNARMYDRMNEYLESQELYTGPFAEGYRVPHMYQVLLVADEETKIGFIVFILKNFFHKSDEELVENVETLEKTGEVLCGHFSREVAESKVVEVIECSRSNHFPLKCIMRKDYEFTGKKS